LRRCSVLFPIRIPAQSTAFIPYGRRIILNRAPVGQRRSCIFPVMIFVIQGSRLDLSVGAHICSAAWTGLGAASLDGVPRTRLSSTGVFCDSAARQTAMWGFARAGFVARAGRHLIIYWRKKFTLLPLEPIARRRKSEKSFGTAPPQLAPAVEFAAYLSADHAPRLLNPIM